MNQPSSDSGSISLQAWLLLLAVSLLWGSSYILIKRALVGFDPVQMAAWRIVLSGLLVLPFFVREMRRLDWGRWKALLVVGLFGTAIPSWLFALAQTQISSALSGLLSSLTPLFTLLLGILCFGLPLVWSKVLGVLLGLAGAAWLLLGQDGTLQGPALYGLFAVLGAFCYGINANAVKAWLQDMSPRDISIVSFVLIVPAGLLMGLQSQAWEPLANHPQGWASLGWVVALALGGTVIASFLFFRLVQLTSAVFGSMTSYLVPVVAVLWGWLDGETISLHFFAGMALILAGLWLSQKNN